MTSMVERVARALCEANCLHIGGPDAETLVPGNANWTFHTSDAKAAIAAMRQPTEAMKRRGGDEPVTHAWSSEGEFTTSDSAGDVWAAMIEEALR